MMILALVCAMTFVPFGTEESESDEIVCTLRMTEFPPVSAQSIEADRVLRSWMHHPRFSRAVGQMDTLDGPVVFRVWLLKSDEPSPETATSLGLHFLLIVKEFLPDDIYRLELLIRNMELSLDYYPQYDTSLLRIAFDKDNSLVMLLGVREDPTLGIAAPCAPMHDEQCTVHCAPQPFGNVTVKKRCARRTLRKMVRCGRTQRAGLCR